jgi:tetratricopeptide (TPR) repeat protein
LQAAWLVSAAVLLCASLWPGVQHIDELYGSLESTRAETPRAAQLLDVVRRMPRYVDNDDVRVVERALFVRQTTTLTEDQVNETLNFFAPYRRHSDGRIRSWATLSSAEAYRFVDKPDPQIELYRELTDERQASPWQRWYAHMELGSIYYTLKGDPTNARLNWEAALRYRRTRGLLENLAILEEDQGRWDKAAERYEEALEVIERYKREKGLVTLPDQEAGLYSNWCNMLRKRAKQAIPTDAPQLREQAQDLCRKAIAAYSAYMDARWNLARVQLDENDYAGADDTLRTALYDYQNLIKTSPQSLRRYGYTEYGEKYTIWLLVVSRFLSPQPLRTDAWLLKSFHSGIVHVGPDPDMAVSQLLTELEKRGLTMEEDKAILGRMRAARYLRSNRG